jgi:hypothetical protein
VRGSPPSPLPPKSPHRSSEIPSIISLSVNLERQARSPVQVGGPSSHLPNLRSAGGSDYQDTSAVSLTGRPRACCVRVTRARSHRELENRSLGARTLAESTERRSGPLAGGERALTSPESTGSWTRPGGGELSVRTTRRLGTLGRRNLPVDNIYGLSSLRPIDRFALRAFADPRSTARLSPSCSFALISDCFG